MILIYVRLVLDTDVIIAAMRSQLGASRKLLVDLDENKITGLISVPLILEYESVMNRTKHLQESGFNHEKVNDVLDMIAAKSEHVKIHYFWRPQLKDIQDEMVLDTAVNGNATHIVTFNKKHFLGVTKNFKLKIATPGEIIKEITE